MLQGRSVASPRLLLGLVILFAIIVRANFVVSWLWVAPYRVHHVDEPVLPLEAMALWEGVTPREVGWPASTIRLILSASYGVALLTEDPAIVRTVTSPPAFFDRMAQFERARLVDPAPLFRIGRSIMVIVGVLQVLACYWAGRRWSSVTGGVVAAWIVAISPMAVSSSQLVLAEIFGLLFATLGLGAVSPSVPLTWRLVSVAGLLFGLAGATKFHFGLWLVSGILACWVLPIRPSTRSERATRLLFTVTMLAAALTTILFFVPWFWLNAVLAAKEFGGVVLAKIGHGSSGVGQSRDNLVLTVSALGWLPLAGAIPGIYTLFRSHGVRALVPLAPIGFGLLALSGAALVFDRYGLLLLAGAAIACGHAVSQLAPRGRLWMTVCVTLMVGFSAATLVELYRSQLKVGQPDAYALAHEWITGHMAPGSRLAVDSVYPHFLPRSREQLEEQIRLVESPDGYRRKWHINGFDHGIDTVTQPMRLAILNDEFYRSHWDRIELGGDTSKGYVVTTYHDEPRFNSILTADAVGRFLDGLTDPTLGFDALLLDRDRELGIAPDRVFRGASGRPQYLYLRSSHARSPSVR